MYCLCYVVYIVNALTRAGLFSDSAAAINFNQLTSGVTSRSFLTTGGVFKKKKKKNTKYKIQTTKYKKKIQIKNK